MEERNDAGRKAGAPRDRFRTAQAVLVVLLVIGLLTAIFIFQNTTPAKVNFLFWSASVPLAGAFILSAALGGILTFLIVFVRQRRIARGTRSETSKSETA